MKLFNTKQAIQEKDINIQLRQIRKQKYMKNMQQKKIFQHLIKNNMQLDLKKPQQAKILANGIPEIYRELIWSQLLMNNHGITPKTYQALIKKVIKLTNEIIEVNRNQELQQLHLNKSKSQGYAPSQQINMNLQKISKWLDTIKMDIPRTFSELKIFQSLTPPYQSLKQSTKTQLSLSSQEKQPFTVNNESRALFNILSCWVAYRDDIGYRQGMSQIAGYLFIELNNELKAFQIFCSLMTSDALYQFFVMNLEYISAFCTKVHFRLREKNDELFEFMDTNKVDYKLFVLDWMFSLFTKCFQLDTIGKIWDILLLNRMEEKILVNVIVEIICAFEENIFRFDMNGDIDVMEICRFLKKAKVDEIRQENILTNLQEVPL